MVKNQPLKHPSNINKSISIIQFGAGNFIRGFVDYAIQVLNEQFNFNAKITIVKPTNSISKYNFIAQNYKFHVFLEGIFKNKKIRKVKIIDCIKEIVNPYLDFKNYIKSDINVLKEFYRQLGYYFVKIDAEIEKLDKNRVNIVYLIEKGDRAKISNHRQGFYIHRENRVIQAGGWLQVFNYMEPHYSLLRIEFDFGFRADEAFKVDVKKSRIHFDPRVDGFWVP